MGHDIWIIDKNTGKELCRNFKDGFAISIPYAYIDIWNVYDIQGHKSDIVARTINDVLDKFKQDSNINFINNLNEYSRLFQDNSTTAMKSKFTYFAKRFLEICSEYPDGYWFSDNCSSGEAFGEYKRIELYGVRPISDSEIYHPPNIYCYYKGLYDDKMHEIRDSNDIRTILRDEIWDHRSQKEIDFWEEMIILIKKYAE